MQFLVMEEMQWIMLWNRISETWDVKEFVPLKMNSKRLLNEKTCDSRLWDFVGDFCQNREIRQTHVDSSKWIISEQFPKTISELTNSMK